MMAGADGFMWSRPEWLEEAKGWIGRELARQNVSISAPIEQPHLRAWGTVLRVPTGAGDFYFKANAPVSRFEADVTQAMYRWRPDCTPEVVAIDAVKGWLLMADGGRRARETLADSGDVRVWERLLADYAGLQIDLAGHVPELLEMGAPDARLGVLPGFYEDILADRRWLVVDRPEGISSAELRRLEAFAPEVGEMCRRLAAYAVPASLHHNDLHDGNIFLQDGRTVFFDWGDSSISHPFFSLRTVFVSIENRFSLEENDPIFEKLGRSYLASWRDYGTMEDLSVAFAIARRLWSLSSAVKYWTFLNQLEGMADEYGHAVAGLLQEFLEANPSGRGDGGTRRHGDAEVG